MEHETKIDDSTVTQNFEVTSAESRNRNQNKNTIRARLKTTKINGSQLLAKQELLAF